MLIRNWLHRLNMSFDWQRMWSSTSRRPAPRQRQYRSIVEVLESRTLLTPQISSIVASTDANMDVEVSLLATASPGEAGAALSVSSVGSAANGTVSMLAGGVVQYTPNSGYNGTDSFSYTVAEDDGSTATSNVSVTINPPAPPGAPALTAMTDANNCVDISLLASASTGQAGDSLTVSNIGTPANGSIALLAGGVVEYTPNAGFYGTDSFSYTILESNGGSVSSNVTITVNAPNPPQATDMTATTAANNCVDISVLSSASPGQAGDMLTISNVGTPANGSAYMLAGGVIEYMPNTGFYGTDAFNYTLLESNGETVTRSITVTITAPPQPQAAALTATTDSDNCVDISLLASASPGQAGDTLMVSSVGTPANGSACMLAGGVVEYTPNSGFYGTDTFSYTLMESNGETVTSSVTVTVNAPAAPTITLSVEYGSGKSVTLTGTVGGPTPGGMSVNISGVASGSVVTASDGTFRLVTDATALGTISAVTSNSAGIASNTASVTLVSNAPTITSLTSAANSDGYWKIQGTVSDETPDGLAVLITGLPSGVASATTTQADGSFTCIFAAASGLEFTATATVTDVWGLQGSNTTYIMT